MDLQTKACHAILNAIKADNGRKKKVDHWKPFACKALGIKKMGKARWDLLLEHGEKKGVFYQDPNATPSKTILVEGKKPTTILDLNIEDSLLQQALEGGEALDPATAYEKDKKRKKKSQVVTSTEIEETEIEEKRDKKGHLPSEYVEGTSFLKTSSTRPRGIKRSAIPNDTHIPKKGDIFWVVNSNLSVVQVEVDSVNVGAQVVPLNKKDGHWSYQQAEELFSSKKEAKSFASNVKDKKYEKGSFWSRDAMDQQNYALFKEYEENRDSFLKWLEKKERQKKATAELEDLLNEF